MSRDGGPGAHAGAESTLGPIRVELTARQRAELLAEARRYQSVPPAIVGFFGVVTVALAAYLLWHAVIGLGPLSPVPIVAATLTYAVAGAALALYRLGTRPVIEGSYRVTAAGLYVETQRQFGTIPWALIEKIIDTGSAFLVIRYLTSPPVVIPKAALAGDPSEVWEELERRLSGRRLLVRPDRKRTVILNTLPPAPRPEYDHAH